MTSTAAQDLLTAELARLDTLTAGYPQPTRSRREHATCAALLLATLALCVFLASAVSGCTRGTTPAPAPTATATQATATRAPITAPVIVPVATEDTSDHGMVADASALAAVCQGRHGLIHDTASTLVDCDQTTR